MTEEKCQLSFDIFTKQLRSRNVFHLETSNAQIQVDNTRQFTVWQNCVRKKNGPILNFLLSNEPSSYARNYLMIIIRYE